MNPALVAAAAAETAHAKCARCERPMTLSKKPRPGHVNHKAAGYCIGCYSWWRRATRPDVRAAEAAAKIRRRASAAAPLIDPIAVERATHPHWPCPHLNKAERCLAVAALTKDGWTANRIAARFGITGRTVQRIRARLRRQATA